MNEDKWKQYLNTLNNYSGCTSEHTGHIAEFYIKHDAGNGKILDVGCAQGNFKVNCKSEYSGIDFPDDIHELPHDDNTFDIVFCNHVLEHVLSPVIVLTEMKRVMDKDGFMIIGVPCCPHFLSEEHFTVLTRKGWEQLFKMLSLVIEDFEDKEHSLHYKLKVGKVQW